jgi:dihydropteroate synthase
MPAPYEIMGVVNVTPDSFSDGGASSTRRPRDRARRGWPARAPDPRRRRASRPARAPTGAVREELARVVPVVEGLAGLERRVSVDTMKLEWRARR